MQQLNALKAIFRSINQHPLAAKHPWKAYSKFLGWQIGNLIKDGEKKVPFTSTTYLIAKKGMNGATGNIYMGLHEFEDMGFLLHFLRKEDVFFDIGANVGSYTVLAAGHVGCTTLAFEPIPSTFASLQKNIAVNKIGSKVKALNVGVGSKKDTLIFTTNHDTINHVLVYTNIIHNANAIEVPVISIDNTIFENEVPTLVKIDVEGFETHVVKGMTKTLQHPKLKGIIIELNGSGERYGFDETAIHIELMNYGFLPYAYNPFNRSLSELKSFGKFNTIYLRDITFVKNRVKTAESVQLFSDSF